MNSLHRHLRRVHTARYESDATRRSPRVQQLHACFICG